MATKRHKPEEIVTRLRQVEVLVGQGMSRIDAIREIGGAARGGEGALRPYRPYPTQMNRKGTVGVSTALPEASPERPLSASKRT